MNDLKTLLQGAIESMSKGQSDAHTLNILQKGILNLTTKWYFIDVTTDMSEMFTDVMQEPYERRAGYYYNQAACAEQEDPCTVSAMLDIVLQRIQIRYAAELSHSIRLDGAFLWIRTTKHLPGWTDYEALMKTTPWPKVGTESPVV